MNSLRGHERRACLGSLVLLSLGKHTDGPHVRRTNQVVIAFVRLTLTRATCHQFQLRTVEFVFVLGPCRRICEPCVLRRT
jgi:hypothetical protein